MHPLLELLTGTDRRSIKGVDKVVSMVANEPALFGILFDGMLHDNPVIRMRCADAVEKITRTHPDMLAPFKKKLLEEVSRIEQQEVRWHVAQLFSRLHWSSRERRRIRDILWIYATDKSRIVRTFSMQALADVAERDEKLRRPILRKLEELTRTGTPAMRSRGKKLLAKLKNQG